MIQLAGKKVVVFGLGLSGQALVKKLSRLGARVAATDSRKAVGLKIGEIKKNKKIQLFLGGHPRRILEEADLIVLSPGVHLDLPVLKEARKRLIPVMGEIELAGQLLRKPVIGITGTNGKSTTTALIEALLKNGGLKAKAAGNIGYPLIAVDDQNLDYVVAEISSYQLESIEKFNPFISVILNITPDHVERHHTMANYIRAKKRIFENHDSRNFLIYNAQDPLVVKIATSAKSRKTPFSIKGPVKTGIYVDRAGWIISEIFGPRIKLLPARSISLPGAHNVENFMAAAAAALMVGVKPESVRKTLKTFKGLEHRIELVRALSGVKFYNDSKGTNPDSTIIALKALSEKNKKRIILIAGGRDKGTDLGGLGRQIKKTVKALVLIGEAAPRFEKYFKKIKGLPIHRVKQFGPAVKLSFSLSRPGDIILLSPACASFDMFRSFEHRGRVFKKLVRRLEETGVRHRRCQTEIK